MFAEEPDRQLQDLPEHVGTHVVQDPIPDRGQREHGQVEEGVFQQDRDDQDHAYETQCPDPAICGGEAGGHHALQGIHQAAEPQSGSALSAVIDLKDQCQKGGEQGKGQGRKEGREQVEDEIDANETGIVSDVTEDDP